MLKRIFLLGAWMGATWLTAQEDPSMLNDTISLSAVEVMAELPITSQKIGKKTLEEKNLGQDMPVLLKNATSVVTTSDAGNGIGYTAMRVRGIAQSQINVTFNGVPVNDSESHGVFWVDFPDVASSTSGVLIQRGVGTSSNGAAAFGGSVNLETNNREKNGYVDVGSSFGSFNTQKYMVNAGSGDFANDKLNVDARVSYLKSDGYIDRASSKLFSAATNLRYKPNKNTELHVMNLFGHERTYQAWYGLDRDTYDSNPTFNYAGAIYHADGSIDYYDNQVDNYDQNHLHAYWRQQWNEKWKSTTTFHWTRGLGYYEEYTQDANLTDYRINNGMETADLVRRQWLSNHFVGGIFNLEGKNLGNADVYLGASINKYIGGHYGKVIEVVDVNYTPTGKYYENESHKTEFSGFAKALYHVGNVELFGDIQIRNINYDADYAGAMGENPIKDFTPYDFNWTFVNPKAGINYRLPQSKLYASYGLTHREPTRSDILANLDKVKPETLHDFELGFRTNAALNLGMNVYYMHYLDQLVLTGQVDDVGNPIRENVGKSYRAGVELDASKLIFHDKVNLFGNLNVSKNKNLDYVITNEDETLTNLGDTSIAYTPEIITSFGFDVYPVKNLKLNLTHKYVGEQYVTNTEVSDGVLDAYFVSDFLAKYDVYFNKTNMEFSVLVNNLWDKAYANNGYYYEGTYLFPQAGRNFLAGVKVKF